MWLWMFWLVKWCCYRLFVFDVWWGMRLRLCLIFVDGWVVGV